MWRRSFLLITALASACDGNDTTTNATPPDAGGDQPGPDAGDSNPVAHSTVFVETNDPAGNRILAFARTEDGALAGIGKPIDAGGLGISAGGSQRLGPLDSDRALAMSPDGTIMYAVNAGSASIAAFHVLVDGRLQALPGSPWPSNGANPVSIGVAGDRVIVVDKAVDQRTLPRYQTFRQTADGLVALDALTTPLGSSPSVAYVSRNGRFVFGTEFFDGARPSPPPKGQLDVLVLGPDGKLAHAPGSPHALPEDTSGIAAATRQVAVNLVEHPTRNILYVAFPTRSQIGVYRLDETTGALTFVRIVADSGRGVRALAIDLDGRYLYAVNAASGSISSYDLTDPLAPVETSVLELRQAKAGPPFIDTTGARIEVTSQPFQIAFDSTATHLYVVSQRVTTDVRDPLGNYLHVLEIGKRGVLGEPTAPLDLRDYDVPPTARPQGVLVYAGAVR